MDFTHLTTYQMIALQSRSNRAFKNKMSEFLRDYNITMMQWSIIGMVHDSGPNGMRISDLANELDTSMAFITTTVNMLEAKGLVQKAGHERDSRAKLVRLSEAFQPKVAVIEAGLHEQIYTWYESRLSLRDLGIYLQSMSIIAKA